MQISGLLSPDARLEEDVAKGRRDWAYSERDKVTITTIIMTNFVIIISITIIVTIIITRPKPAYGRQGLAGWWGHDTYQAGTFWGVLNISLRACGAQLGFKPTWDH